MNVVTAAPVAAGLTGPGWYRSKSVEEERQGFAGQVGMRRR